MEMDHTVTRLSEAYRSLIKGNISIQNFYECVDEGSLTFVQPSVCGGPWSGTEEGGLSQDPGEDKEGERKEEQSFQGDHVSCLTSLAYMTLPLLTVTGTVGKREMWLKMGHFEGLK